MFLTRLLILSPLNQALCPLYRFIRHMLFGLCAPLLCKFLRMFYVPCFWIFLLNIALNCTNYLQEYLSISRMRLIYITGAQMNPTYFTVLVRSIPWSPDESYSETVRKFFTNYHESGYLSHQMIYRSGTVQKLLVRIYKIFFNSFCIFIIDFKFISLFTICI